MNEEITYEVAVVEMDADFNNSIKYHDSVMTSNRKKAMATGQKYLKEARTKGRGFNCYVAVLKYVDWEYEDHLLFSEYLLPNGEVYHEN